MLTTTISRIITIKKESKITIIITTTITMAIILTIITGKITKMEIKMILHKLD